MESAYEGDITMEHAVNIDFVGGLIGQDSGSGGTLAVGGWTGRM